MDRRVTAPLGADRPRAADVPALGCDRVVAALAVRVSNRMDRRQVDDVEPEVRELRQHFLDACEAAPRAWEQFVPRAEPCTLDVDVDTEFHAELDGAVAVVALDGERFLERHVLAQQRAAFRELAGEVTLPALELARYLPLPRRDPVGPGDDAESPAPKRING